VFDYIAYVKEKGEKRAHLEQLMASALESEQVLEESAPKELEESAPEELEESVPEESDTKALVSGRVGQVHRRNLLMH
jgi:hypothetical protein